MIGTDAEDVLLMEESQENVHLSVRHTKDFQFLNVNAFSTQSSKVCLLECFFVPLILEGEMDFYISKLGLSN